MKFFFYNAVLVRFCSPVRLEFLAHAIFACCGKCLHISVLSLLVRYRLKAALFSYYTGFKP